MHIARKKEDRKPLENASVVILGDANRAQDIVRIILQQCGANVMTAKNAIQAAGLLMKVRPDLFISSMHEPWAVEMIRSNASIPSIGLVTHPCAEFEKALNLGFCAASSVAEPKHILATAEQLVDKPMLVQ